MRAEASHVYELTRNPRPGTVALLGASCLFWGGTALATESDAGRVFVVVVGALMVARGVQIALYWPTRVVADEAGLTFCARVRTRFVPWSDLRTVRVSRGKHGGGIRWRLAEGPSVITAATFDRLHHLLVDVERHAPHVRVID